ncbi:gluconate 2-dehydrogenase subunit 3 family protein [uncultured Thioclava sp.]|uniref:gluconate 2-dehydrogenase subunit 3 family protein n=1 Tax=uncultured Thioclava sp. TaxID=473858 RepID=UPI0025D51F1A|nr:gluconate 2-dehydrogenase subunit 3 family protein [uncultured Thioclava sp.]
MPLRFGGEGFGARTPILNAKRRAVLMGLLSVGLASVCGSAVADTAPMASLTSVVDTLLPADDFSPSASALEVDRDIADFVAENEMMTRLFVAALNWMDHLTDKPFHALTLSQQTEVLTAMESADFNAIPGRFYHILRALAVEFYYARSEAIVGFPLDPAPQPNGYPPPWG